LSLVVWWALTFWVFMAIDYSPVLLWASELPRGLRSVLLVGVLGGYAWIILYQLLGRLWVRLSDRSLALVVERRFPQFADSLITSVELAAGNHPLLTLQMLVETHARARQNLPTVKPAAVFRWKPLVRKLLLAALLVVPCGVLAATRAEMVNLGLKRLYGLSDQTWPRRAHIEMVGIQVEHLSAKTGERVWSEVVPFRDGQAKVARGANVAVYVRADLEAKTVPEICRIYYRTADGSRGQVAMRRDGQPRGQYQLFSYAEKPLRGLLGDLQFDVIGHDHRIRGQRIVVVDSPAIVETTLDCRFPDYLVDETQGLWLPRQITYRSSGIQLPRGTRVLIRMRSNKPLRWAELSEEGSGQSRTVELAPSTGTSELQYEVPQLQGSFALSVSLRDTDDVLSDVPHRVVLTAVEDTAPRVDIAVKGIGSAVTPQVMIPIEGSIQDDYAVHEAWFEFQRNDGPPQRMPIPVARDGAVQAALDFRALRTTQPELAIEPGQKLALAVKAVDRCTLEAGPNMGQSPRVELEVVTPEEFLIRMDRRELAERRRLEHVVDELTQTRDALIRVQNEILGISPPRDPVERATESGESQEKPDSTSGSSLSSPEGRLDLRAIRVQQAIRQCEKSAAEVLGIASAFYSIREELINNRIDAEDRKSRLKELVADPLARIAAESFPKWQETLGVLERAVARQQDEAVAAEAAIAQANALLAELNQVLQAILDIESYNELIEIVRNLIREQERLLEETQKARKQQALELLK